jgi:hypothetical protein
LALASYSAFFCLGFRPAFFFWSGILHLGLPVCQRAVDLRTGAS